MTKAARYLRRSGRVWGIFILAASASASAQDSRGILQSTFIGGRGQEQARAMAIDAASGDVLLAGPASAAAIPGTTGGAQPGYAGRQDGWIARLSPDLRTLKQATYLGGTSPEQIDALAIDPASGDVLVAGFTESSDFPGTAGGFQAGRAGPSDVFVARLAADLKTLRQATYLGGRSSEGEALLGIAVDPDSGQVIVTGTTSSNDFPGTAGGAQPTCSERFCGEGFVTRLAADLRSLVQSTYLGGPAEDDAYAVAIHPTTGEIFVGGDSVLEDFSARLGVVARFSADLRELKARVQLGTTFAEVTSLAIDPASGDVVASGQTAEGIEGLEEAAQPQYGGGGADAFVARFDSDLRLLRTTYVGGGGDEYGIIAATVEPGSGAIIVAGRTASPDFPATEGSAQPMLNGENDAFLARLAGDLRTLERATYIGGSSGDGSYRVEVGAPGELVLAGSTGSEDFPATEGGAQPEFMKSPLGDGSSAAFAARVAADLTGSGPPPTTPAATATPTATASIGAGCDGDCGEDGRVTVDDLIKAVLIALGNAPTVSCAESDPDRSGEVTIDELVGAVKASIDGCP